MKLFYNQTMRFEELKEINDSELSKVACEVIECTRNYRKECNELYKRILETEGAVESFTKRILFSQGTFFSNPMHNKYYDDLNALEPKISELVVKEDNKNKSEIVDLVIKEITEKANEYEQKFIRINYDADDYIFHNLIKYMSDDGLKDALKDFNNRKKSTILPNQEKLIKEIKDEMKKRGLEVPKNKLFGLLK